MSRGSKRASGILRRASGIRHQASGRTQLEVRRGASTREACRIMEPMLDVAEVRRRLVHTIESVRHDAALRRQAADRAAAEFGPFLETVATPVFRHLAMALRAE